jgi:hypothetical protein
MTLAQFAVAVGAGTKWVQNAAAALGRPFAYTEEEARRLGLTRVIHGVAGMPLQRAWELAGEALASPRHQQVMAEATDGSVQVTVDVARYRSSFAARLAAARREQPQRRGRPARRAKDPVAAAREYGIDLSLLQSNLLRTPEERLRIAGANAEFARRFRGLASK